VPKKCLRLQYFVSRDFRLGLGLAYVFETASLVVYYYILLLLVLVLKVAHY